MYDEELAVVTLTTDEVEMLKELLSYRLDTCVSVGEELTVRNLLEKITEV